MIEKPTWIIHNVLPDRSDLEIGNYFGNYHTHGLEMYGHREICIPFLLESRIACGVINGIGIEIANNGLILSEGLISGQLQGGYDIKVICFDNDPMMYIILPDENNKFPGDDGCDPEYAKQEAYARRISGGSHEDLQLSKLR